MYVSFLCAQTHEWGFNTKNDKENHNEKGKSNFSYVSSNFCIGCLRIKKGSRDGKEEKKDIKIACNQVSENSLKAAKESMEAEGYTPEFVVFSNNIEALQAVQDGNVDASFAQHEPFMKSFNEQKGGELAMMTPHVYYTGIGLYSSKYDKIDELPDGAQIAIMNDAMNRDNSLLMMQDAGLIKLSEEKKSGYTALDIVDNPKTSSSWRLNRLRRFVA